jgi:DNA-binding response OmpR family regulator
MDDYLIQRGNHQTAVPPEDGRDKPSLLFVDDDGYMRRLMAARLERIGAAVEAVPSAQAALAYLESNRPDLIISDAVMPAMNGFDLCRRLKDDPLLQSIPFLILTALTRDLRVRSLEAGADDYLSKLENDVVFRLRTRQALELGARLNALPGAEPEPDHPVLLVVSGSGAIRAQLETNLQKDGIQVQGRPDLDEALAWLGGTVPDALALDLALGPDPAALAAWIDQARALPGCAALPIEALASKEEEAGLPGLEFHLQDRLPKPLDGPECRHRLGLLLRIARM